jgi:hypothetical protein
VAGLAGSGDLNDGQSLWRERLGLWSGAPGFINGVAGSVGGALLLEDGFFTLQEDGFYILLDP